MQTVGKLIGRSQLVPEPDSPELISPARLGIEIELEGFSESDFESIRDKLNLWEVKEDGSLRNGGVEFVTIGGLGGKTLCTAIEEIDSALNEVEYNASWRCSTHIHVNMLDFTPDQVVKFILAYMCVEPVLFDQCMPYRKSSNFCVPLYQSIGPARAMLTSIRDGYNLGRIRGVKYMALNALPLGSLGTVEFRGSHALTSKEELLALCNRMLSIKEFIARFEGNMDDLVTLIHNEGYRVVLKSGIPEVYVPSEEELTSASMSAWMCLKYYQRDTERIVNRQSEEPLQVVRDGVQEVAFGDWITSEVLESSTRRAPATNRDEIIAYNNAIGELTSRLIVLNTTYTQRRYHNNRDVYVRFVEDIIAAVRNTTALYPRIQSSLYPTTTSCLKVLAYTCMPCFGTGDYGATWIDDFMFALGSICNPRFAATRRNALERASALMKLVMRARGLDTRDDGRNRYSLFDANSSTWSVRSPNRAYEMLGLEGSGHRKSLYALVMHPFTHVIRLRNRGELSNILARANGRSRVVQVPTLVPIGSAWAIFQFLGVSFRDYINEEDHENYINTAAFLTQHIIWDSKPFYHPDTHSYMIRIIPSVDNLTGGCSIMRWSSKLAENQDSTTVAESHTGEEVRFF